MTLTDATVGDYIVAVDDIAFLNCEKSYQPPGKSVFTHMSILEYMTVLWKNLEENIQKNLADSELLFASSALSASDCSFEDGLCVWVQGAEDELDWLSRSGPTETPNTGPAGDHTTGKGHINLKHY